MIKSMARYNQSNAQIALNNLLWKIVMEQGGALNVPQSDLDSVPSSAALEVKFDSATNRIIVIAGNRQTKSGLIIGG